MKQYPFDRDLTSESDVLDYYVDAIHYRNSHKSESTEIAIHVFNRTHPKVRLSFAINRKVERLRDEFGALEAPGMPEDDTEDPNDYSDRLWARLLNLTENEKRTV